MFKGFQNTKTISQFTGFVKSIFQMDSGANGLLRRLPSSSLAFSVRYLGGSNTEYCMKVRRSSDNALLDIGWIGADLDTVSLLAFAGAGSAFVHTWYDGSGNNNHATQLVNASQPRIVNAGVLETVNGRPAIYFDGANDFFSLTNIITVPSAYVFSMVSRRTATSTRGIMGLCGDKGLAVYGNFSLTEWVDNTIYAGSTDFYNSITGATAVQSFISISLISGGGQFSLNGSLLTASQTSQVNGSEWSAIAKRDADFSIGWLQEDILWNFANRAYLPQIFSDQSAYYAN